MLYQRKQDLHEVEKLQSVEIVLHEPLPTFPLSSVLALQDISPVVVQSAFAVSLVTLSDLVILKR
ncbi:hypothetical protein C5167_042696 [Papaver somniferum]|uniref:Uncharacterized protein n=1 Tax=Papaver somniferum TaxID=3469 RepID=A0A4Y7L656_PAPSO|nr:hypothetical protein C5167_042696 [Papaver somniferum]